MLAKDTKFAYKIFVSISVLPFRLFTTLTATAATATTTTTTARIKTENPSPNHQSTDTRPQQNTQNQHNKNRMIQRDSKSWNVRYIVRSKSGLQNNQLYFTLRTLPNSSLRYSIFEVHIVEMSQLNFRWQKVMHRNDIMSIRACFPRCSARLRRRRGFFHILQCRCNSPMVLHALLDDLRGINKWYRSWRRKCRLKGSPLCPYQSQHAFGMRLEWEHFAPAQKQSPLRIIRENKENCEKEYGIGCQ